MPVDVLNLGCAFDHLKRVAFFVVRLAFVTVDRVSIQHHVAKLGQLGQFFHFFPLFDLVVADIKSHQNSEVAQAVQFVD